MWWESFRRQSEEKKQSKRQEKKSFSFKFPFGLAFVVRKTVPTRPEEKFILPFSVVVGTQRKSETRGGKSEVKPFVV